mmetsp:Transcript_15699/g.26161  ORF Transcript_15699/g.26161 Transcript_15699/m.26161 type:complete len:132 (+) Transcript_15699:313-708(+)
MLFLRLIGSQQVHCNLKCAHTTTSWKARARIQRTKQRPANEYSACWTGQHGESISYLIVTRDLSAKYFFSMGVMPRDLHNFCFPEKMLTPLSAAERHVRSLKFANGTWLSNLLFPVMVTLTANVGYIELGY